MTDKYVLPKDFSITFEKISFNTHRLITSQSICLLKERCFEFFKDPCNLYEITPDWLDFKMLNCQKVEVYEGAEFEYSIKVFGFKRMWKSKIIEYKPPDSFIDIQLEGPYKFWLHLHIFYDTPEGTLMKDLVTYSLPLYSIPFHWLIKRQLKDIFSYRSARIQEWATGNFKRKSNSF
ncbi:MAG: SRPBCC family protein [Thermodesulfovibrionales bacterium]|nr:SRPBCC family protein [Thermodesulfovibrionales bacterium]